MNAQLQGLPARADPASNAVDERNPWLGLASFTEETRAYFYGREDEVAELVRRVQRKTLTLLFGQSGLGKTSILRAGIVPWLRPTGYSPVYVRIDYSRESPSPAEQIKAAIFRATQESGQWTQTGVAVAGESLWEFLHHRDDILRDASGKTLIPLLIFDQFEEIFTLAQTDDFGRKRAAEFIEDLADLVENRAPKALEARIEHDESAGERFDFTASDYRLLIALREDYLAHLEALKDVMPSITQNRMRLARMTGEQALSAVVKPGGKLVSLEVAESIVRFIAGGSELRNAEVEPSLLSLICRELNNARIAKGRAEISVDLLAGSHDTILADFYERTLADQPEALRRYIEDELLTDSGFRESIAEERVRKAFAAAGARPDALATLVDRRLLRIEERLDVRRVELTHDVLCSVVRASRDLRHEREARDEAERKLDEQRARQRATRKALVLVRYGSALRIQSKLDESQKALSDAVDVLGKLRAQGDQSEATAIGLGLGLWAEARVAGSKGRRPEERELIQQAVAVLKPLASAPTPSVPLRRAYGIALTYLGFTQLNNNQEEAAVKTLEEAREAYRSIDDLKLDPSNQIAWNNLAAARQGTAFWSWGLGRIRESQEEWRAGLAIEPNVRPSAMIGYTLGTTAGYRAMLEADLGNRQAAEAALADNRRLIEMAVHDLPPDAFGRGFIPEQTGYYGFPGSGIGYGGYALPLAAGEYETLRNLARASARRIEQLKAADAQRELDKNRLLEMAYRTAAEASYRLKDYATADAEIKRALEIRRAIPKRNLFDERDASDALMLAAMIAARQERYPEAQQIIEPVLKFHRGLYARKDNEDQSQRIQL